MSAPDLSPEALDALEERARAVAHARVDRGRSQDPWDHAFDLAWALSPDWTPDGVRSFIAAASPDAVLALVEAARERDRLAKLLPEVLYGTHDNPHEVDGPCRYCEALNAAHRALNPGSTDA